MKLLNSKVFQWTLTCVVTAVTYLAITVSPLSSERDSGPAVEVVPVSLP